MPRKNKRAYHNLQRKYYERNPSNWTKRLLNDLKKEATLNKTEVKD